MNPLQAIYELPERRASDTKLKLHAAVGGLGGCPYAPGAKGNVATEKVAAHLERLGYSTGLDMGVVAQAAEFAKGLRA